MLCVADFETNTLRKEQEELLKDKKIRSKDLSTDVWGWGITEVGRTKSEEIKLGTRLDDFMKFVLKLPNFSKIYFHNLKFDGHFILSWLLNNGYKMVEKREQATSKSFHTLISDAGMFYSITVVEKKYKRGAKKIHFYDSLKKLPYSIDRIAKSFNLEYQKVEVDQDFYYRQRDKNHKLTKEEKEYLINDVRVLSQALQILEHQNMSKMTTASNALYNYKLSIGGEKQFRVLFPVLENEIDYDIKKAYRGGVSMVKESERSKTIGKGLVYDVNSMYPSIMRTKELPTGYPLFYQGQYVENKEYPLYIQEIRCEFKLKKDHLPTLQIKGQLTRYKPNEYLTESKGETTIQLTNVDLKLFLDHYDVKNIEYISGYMFKSRNDLFVDYIDHWSHVKENSQGAVRELAKLMLNSLYGKFGTKTNITSKHAYLEDGVVKLKTGELEMITPIYSAIAVFITSYGRDLLLRTAQQNYDRFLYCDTDSIHLKGLEEPKGIKIHKTKLGYWDHEGTFKRAKFHGAKCYIEDMTDGKLKVVCAGMTKAQHSQVTFENFNIGLTVSGKLVPKVVNGGVVLINTDYEVKVRGFIT